MSPQEFALFETTVGRCAIAWNARGVAGVQLPGRSDSATQADLLRRFPEAREVSPPSHIQHAIDDMVALLDGEARDLSDIALDMSGVPPFNQHVYTVARTIPPGSIQLLDATKGHAKKPPRTTETGSHSPVMTFSMAF